MKTMMRVKWAAVLMLAAALMANAQGPGGGRGPQGGGQQGGPGGGDFKPPSPDEIVKHMLADFDGNKDGKLDATELKKSIEAHQKQRMEHGSPQGGPGGGQQRGAQGGPGGFQGGQQGGPQGERPEPPAPDKIAAKWLEEFDADKNGTLSADELQKALAAHRPPMQGGPGEQRGGPQGGPGGGPGF